MAFGRWATSAATALVITLFGLLVAGSAAAQTDDGGVTGDDEETLVVATKALEPFVFIDEVEQGSPTPSGFSVDYWNEVAERLGVQTEWRVEATVAELIEAAANGEVDASIAGISITREREEIIDFSQPYYISGQQIAVRSGSSASTFGTLARLIGSRTFLVPLAILVGLVIVVSHLVWWFERGHESDDFPFGYRDGIGEALWWSTVSVITGGEAVKNINTPLSRLIAVFWMLVGLFLLAFVTARATSVLTVAELESDISGLGDLAGRPVATVAGTASVPFLETALGDEPRQEADLDSAIDALAEGEVDAVVFDAPVLAYALNQRGDGGLELVEPIIGRDPYGIVLPAQSPRREAVNAVVIEIGRDGTLDELCVAWFGKRC